MAKQKKFAVPLRRPGVVYIPGIHPDLTHAKYSPDQPRDHGRFAEVEGDSGGGEGSSGEGGGGGVSSPDFVAQRLPPSVDPKEIPRADNLSPAMRAIETKFADELAADPQGAWRRYQQLPGTLNGKVLSTDSARELSEEYQADRSMSAAVHEPASWFMKQAYAERLQQEPGPGENKEVLFMAGGTGAGKTTAINASRRDLIEKAMIVYDSNFGGLSSSRGKIEAALDAGKRAVVVDVDRDPLSAFTAGIFPDGPGGTGVLTRAMKTGRTVPIEEHLKTHVESRKTVPTLEQEFSREPRVEVRYVNNNLGGPGTAKFVSGFDTLPTPAYNSIRKDLYAALERAHREGRISEQVYRGTLHAPVEDVAKD